MLLKQGYRGIATGGPRDDALPPPHVNFQTKQGQTVSVSSIMDIAFYTCSEIILTRNLMNFTVYKQFRAGCYFF